MRSKHWLIVMLVTAVCGGFFTAAAARPHHPLPSQDDDLAQRPISAVAIEGLGRLDESLVRGQLRTEVGNSYYATIVREDVRRLYNLGGFKFVTAEAELQHDASVAVIFKVAEQAHREQEAEGMRAEARELLAEAERRQEQGHADRARRLINEAEALMQAARHREELVAQLEEFHREIDELHERGQHDRAERLEREAENLAARLHARHRFRPAEDHEPQELERRMHHLDVAAEHLEAAGYEDWAQRLAGHAEELEAEYHARREHRDRDELAAHVEELTEVVHHLHREVEELREVVRDMQERIEVLSARR